MIVRVGIASGDFKGDTNAVIQQAVDVAGAYGGGTVELGAGVYTLYDSVQLRRNVRLVGQGSDTVLRKCDGHSTGFAIDADYGQMKVTVEDPEGFEVGMGGDGGDRSERQLGSDGGDDHADPGERAVLRQVVPQRL